MRAAKLTLGLATGLMLCAAIGHARNADLARMVQTEYDFNDACAREGFKASFLQYLAEDAVMFMPGPLNGHKRISERPDVPGQLRWYPSYAVISGTGELGLSTGPWVSTNEAQKQGFGHFVTVWRKQAKGVWRAALDVGVTHDKLEEAPAPLQVKALAQDGTAATTPVIPIAQAERAFAEQVAAKGYRAAVEQVAHPDLRVYRDGHPPATGAAERGKLLDLLAERVGAVREDAAISSGDFGYGYGISGSAVYVHIWKHEADGWKLLLDLLRPLDPPAG